MKKELLIFGSEGALGKGVSKILSSKDYNNVHLYSTRNSGDLSIEENVKKVFNSITPAKDTIFFLFSTIGGYTGGKSLAETSVEDFEKMVNLNYRISFLLAKYFSLLVKRSAGGSIMFTSAMTSLNASEGSGVYGASKRALNALVDTLAIEGKDFNLSANAIAPYMIDTPANREWFTGDAETLLKPEEIGEFVHNIFNNFHFITGNIFRLTERLGIKL